MKLDMLFLIEYIKELFRGSAFSEFPIWFYPSALFLVLIESVFYKKITLRNYDWSEFRISITDFLLRHVISLIPLNLSIIIWSLAIKHRIYSFSIDSGWKFLFVLFLMEFVFYTEHFFNHRISWFWNTHSVHHSSRQLTLVAAFRIGITGAISGNLIYYAPLLLLGLQINDMLLFICAKLLYQVVIHNEWVGKLGFLELFMNTPSHHRVHHSLNKTEYGCNFGGILIIFDKIFKTFKPEGNQKILEFGLKPINKKYDFISIEFTFWKKFFKSKLNSFNKLD